MNARGFGAVFARLNNIGEKVPDNARKTMHRAADRVVRNAKLMAPVDKHNLEESIKKEISYGFRGRLQINVTAGGFVNGVNVSNYVAEVHENYSSFVPGPNTVAKQNANPQVIVGEKFLERALEQERTKLRQQMIRAVAEALR